MLQPTLSPRVTFTRPAPWVWHVWLDDKRVGTVNGDSSCGFTAKGNDHIPIGHGYLTAEAAMQAWILLAGSHCS
jgi:hypothetical protein